MRNFKALTIFLTAAITIALLASCVERKPERLAKKDSPVSGRLKEMVAAQDKLVANPTVSDQTKLDSMLVFREETLNLISQALVREPEDQYQAALILQASNAPTGAESCLLAYYLAMQAAEKGLDQGRFLAAAAYDRYLVHCGLPQRYGTQYVTDTNGIMTLYPVDTTFPDSERVALDVPRLDQQVKVIDRRKEQQGSGLKPIH